MCKLKSMHKIVIVILVILITCVLAYIGYLYFKFNIVPIAKENIVSEFSQNINFFSVVNEYLDSLGGAITIDAIKSNEYVIKKVDGSKVIVLTIEDKKIANEVEYILFKLKYESIIHNENEIEYIKIGGLSFSQSIIFSKNGDKPYRGNKSSIEPIADSWYYCHYNP